MTDGLIRMTWGSRRTVGGRRFGIGREAWTLAATWGGTLRVLNFIKLNDGQLLRRRRGWIPGDAIRERQVLQKRRAVFGQVLVS